MPHRAAARIALISIAVSGLLCVLKILIGVMAGSTSVVADGVESGGDVLASAIVLFGIAMAARPADADHPYGHGRLETLSGFIVGWILALAGAGICMGSMRQAYTSHAPPEAYAAYPLISSIVMKAVLAALKFRYARLTRSEGLRADAYNDSVDILSGLVALTALSLTLYDPSRFLAADHFGGLGVGVIVIFLGLRVVRDTSLHLIDTMPHPELVEQIRKVSLSVPGALGVEKCFARKTGFGYHVDLHLEVAPEMTVRDSHGIASAVRNRLRDELDWVSDVLVHVEPHGDFD